MRKFVIVLSLLFILVISVAAEEIPYGYNLFDFLGSNHEYYISGTSSVVYELSDVMQVSQVDLVVLSTSVPSVSMTLNGQTFALSVEYLYGSYYRVYGPGSGISTNRIILNYTVNSYTYLKINSFRLYTQNIDFISIGYAVNGNSIAAGNTYTDNFPTTGINQITDRVYSIQFDRYYLYDRIDLELYLDDASLSFLSCAVTGGQIPISLSYVNSEGIIETEYYLFDDDNAYADRGAMSIEFPTGYVTVSIDLSQYPVKRDSVPFLSIGITHNLPSDGYFRVNHCKGILIFDNPSVLYFYFQNLKNWLFSGFASIVNVLNVGGNSGSDFNDSVSTQATEMDNLNDQLQEVTKPPLEDIESSVSDYVSESDINSSTAPLLEIFNSNIFLPVIMMSLILALGAYVLYGKR